jgi:ClpX C4-type zinc finger
MRSVADWSINRLTLGRLRAPRLTCSFCARDSAEVSRLVAGRSAYICDDCIAKCVDVLEAHGGFEPAGKRR